MRKLKIITGWILAAVILAGCQSVFTSTIAVTQVVDSAMKQWAHASNTHQTTAALDAQVIVAHDKYRAAAVLAQVSLKAYKASGNQNDFAAALSIAQAGAGPLIDLIASILTPPNSAQLKTSLAKAGKP